MVPRVVRMLLRRLGIGERRWVPPAEARRIHTELVRSRLATPGSAEPNAPPDEPVAQDRVG